MRTYLSIIFIFRIALVKLWGQINPADNFLNKIITAEADIRSLKGSVSINNYANENEATVAVSEDNQVVLSYKNDKGDGNLYITIFQGNQWSVPKKLNKITAPVKWEKNECISPDGNYIYFTSKQKEGFGGQDIYRSEKLPNGDWGKPKNLGSEINTRFDEQAPYSLPDGILYFSSNKDTTSGSYDIFTSNLTESGVWTKPVNIGYPVERTEDTFYPLTAGTKNQVSSGRIESMSTKKDNYLYTFPNKKNTALTVLCGNIVGTNGEIPDTVKITITDNQTGKPLAVYHSFSKTGHYSIILPHAKNNNIVYQSDGYLFQSKNIDLYKNMRCYEKTNEIQISPISVGSKIRLNNIFFDSFQATLRPISGVELENIFILLNTNPKLSIEIASYMISRKSNKYNKYVSLKRARIIADQMIGKGIEKNRIIACGYSKYKTKNENKKLKRNKELSETFLDEWVELIVIDN